MCKLQESKPHYELQDIFKIYADDFLNTHQTTSIQRKAISDIQACRTSSLGYNARECTICKNVEFSYNSCRNRNCPKCQGQKRFKWIQDRLKTIINVPYFHTVFTVPNQLFDIAIHNQRFFYQLMFKSASDTLKLFANNPKYWDMKDLTIEEPKIELSFFGILHTWGQTLVYHPHIHFIVAGAGILKDDTILEPKYNSKFLFPVKAMSKVFRGKLIEGIKKAYYKNELTLNQDFKQIGFFVNFIDHLVNRKWVVYSKSQFYNSTKIVEYMSRYTHRVALSNSRILSVENDFVRFKYKDYKDSSKIKTMKLDVSTFIQRFIYHIAPKRFYRIRYYGAYQRLSKVDNTKIVTLDAKTLERSTKVKKTKCKKCQSTKIETIVVVIQNNKVVQGVLTPRLLELKTKVELHDSS